MCKVVSSTYMHFTAGIIRAALVGDIPEQMLRGRSDNYRQGVSECQLCVSTVAETDSFIIIINMVIVHQLYNCY